MLEKDIEAHLVKRIKDLGGRAYKFVSPGNAGVPDRLVCLPKGIKIFVELKSPNGKLTALQAAQIKKFDLLGHTVFILKSIEAVDEFIEVCKGMIAK